jgi:DNA mismatch repair protein MutH
MIIPQTEEELLQKCDMLAGMSLGKLALLLNFKIPENQLQRKGWAGKALECILGASAGNESRPDFCNLNIELKTIPMNHLGKPAQSTFVTSIPLLTIHQQTWKTSQCYAKLQRVLWVPIEDVPTIKFEHRRIGQALLWSPTLKQEAVLEQDWNELSFMISSGQLAKIDARIGEYLQVRPKAANARALCDGFDTNGQIIKTLPLGFYLRSSFTAKLKG